MSIDAKLRDLERKVAENPTDPEARAALERERERAGISLVYQVGLPKWPQMLVTGDKLDPAQAVEIIRRTDTFFGHGCYGGNDRGFAKRTAARLGYPKEDDEPPKGETAEERRAWWQECSRRREEWEAKWGLIHTEYVHNSWVASAYIGGPYGWCSPEGRINYADNVGKWPDASNVFEDWKKIAEAFPFVVAEVTLMNAEHCEDHTSPVISFRIRDGVVSVVDPKEEDVHKGRPPPQTAGGASPTNLLSVVFMPTHVRERGINDEILAQWEAHARSLGLVE